MNKYQQPETHTEREREFQLLKYNGISKHTGKRKTRKKFRFFIYQFDVVALFETTRNQANGQPWIYSSKHQKELWKQIETQNLSREVLKAKKVAIRCLYLLGYDLGMVEVCTHTSAPKYTVSQIFNHSRLADQADRTLKQLVQRSQTREKSNENKTPLLGADVEFVLKHNNGKYVLASRYFSKRGKVGYDAIWLRGNRNKHPLVELRPSPTKNPRQLYNNLYRCMTQAVRKINNSQVQWLAGGAPLTRYPIGGHIHFSQIYLTPKLVRALDNYLTLPLSVMESDESRSRRPKYGFIGDYRNQYHGGFEYRTPPSWIVSPTVAKGVLCLAKVIVQDYHKLSYFPFDNYDVHQQFYTGNRESLYSYVRTVWSHLKNCPTYAKYKTELDRFYELIERRYVWNEFEDIRKAWQLPPY
ncbi:putative amidoligase domain-containing protein [Caldalkalibacillus salinus]|uniref:putative amidoligase domain-containing protein n=1 Tax=Caldalkalibacillus salinus TaxID=2803787 RepID=UPI001923A819|nr:hypothetical protein [Caldalkalibacillus salinus]